MLLALGGNGVAAAAKYLQTYSLREYVAAYGSNGQRVCEESRDGRSGYWILSTARIMPSRGWGSQGLREAYSSYLSVASALYALIVLTLFLMTQSIHPMMNAVKGVTP
ncbi:hypothetical protein ACLB1Q_33815 [Escherichia coli]